jgi:autotransporter-associated beta strand protein
MTLSGNALTNGNHSLNVNFDGGTLRALGNGTLISTNPVVVSSTRAINVTVKTGGAIIDSNGKTVSILQPLLHDAGLGVTADGGLTKSGSGTLTLSGLNTYTGNTTISAGALTLANTGQLEFLINANGLNNTITGTGSLTLAGSFLFDLTNAGTNPGDTWNIVNMGSLTSVIYSNSSFSVAGFTTGDNITWQTNANGVTYQYSETTGTLSVVPEPSAFTLVGAGLAGLLMLRRFRRK